MISIFYGNDRMKAMAEIEKRLGQNYEVVEGTELVTNDLPSLLLGASLFAEKRNILIRDLSDNKPVFEGILKYIKTPHNVIIFEIKLDKRTAIFKDLVTAGIEIKEFKIPEKVKTFEIFRVAKTDGKKAVKMLREVEELEDPYRTFGAFASAAIKDFMIKQGAKEKRALKELSNLDMQMKSAKIQPWTLIEAFLIKLSWL